MDPLRRNLDTKFAREGGSNAPHDENANAETTRILVTPATVTAPVSQLPLSAETLMTLITLLQSKRSSSLVEGGVADARTSAIPHKDVLRITAEGEKDRPHHEGGGKKQDLNEFKDYSSAREDSSEDVVEDQQGKLKEILRKKTEAEKILKELNEEIARNQVSKPKPPQDTARPDRRVILKEPVAASAAISRKRYFDNECNSKYNPRAESNPRTSFRMRGSPFTDEILSDPMPQSFRSISIEYDGHGDPEAHVSRFEGLMTLHQYSEGVKYKIFSSTLVNAAQRWF